MLPLFNFVVGCGETELRALAGIADLGDCIATQPQLAARIFASGEMSWCLQTYINLAQRGVVPVTCSTGLRADAINLVHSDRLLELRGNASLFVVCVRADYPSRRWAHFHLVQNKAQVTRRSAYIPHWVQPGLRKRDPARDGVRRVAYAGKASGNLAADIGTWKNLFAPHGIEFVTLPADRWHDLSTTDVLVGIRSFDAKTYDSKPPSKLLNAWHAGVPFIGGNDSAFRQLGCPGDDYLIATNPRAVVEAVLRLRSDPDLYTRLVQNGRRNAQLYTKDMISEVWERVLTEDVLLRFRAWQRSPRVEALHFSGNLLLGLGWHHAKQLLKKSVFRHRYRPSGGPEKVMNRALLHQDEL